MNEELAVQLALRNRLLSSGPIVLLVPANNILDRNARPAPDPSIIIGEGQSVDDGDTIGRTRLTVYLDLHVWKREEGLSGAKTIASAIRYALNAERLVLADGFHCVDARVANSRFMRDPDGLTSHAVVSIVALVERVS